MLKSPDNLLVNVRLRKKSTSFREIGIIYHKMAGRKDEFYRGPTRADRVGQFQAIH